MPSLQRIHLTDTSSLKPPLKQASQTAAATKGSEIIVQDKSGKPQIFTLDLNDHVQLQNLAKTHGGKNTKALISIELSNGESVLINTEGLTKDKLLEALDRATNQVKPEIRSDFVKSAAPIIETIRKSSITNQQPTSESAELVKSGTQKYDKADDQGAVTDFSKAIQKNSSNADAFLGRGKAYHQLGQDNKAIADYKQAIALNPKHAESHYRLGDALAKSGKFEEANQAFDQAIQLETDNPQLSKHRKAGLYQSKGGLSYELAKVSTRQSGLSSPQTIQHLENSKAALDTSIALGFDDPKSQATSLITRAKAHTQLALSNPDSYENVEHLAAAEADLTQAIALNPKSSKAYFRRGNVYGKQGKIELAKADFEKSLELDPTNTHAKAA